MKVVFINYGVLISKREIDSFVSLDSLGSLDRFGWKITFEGRAYKLEFWL